MGITPLQKPVVASDIAPERLAGNTTLTEQQKIGEASRQFEAILLRQILAATQKTVIPSKFADNSTSAEIYRDMITNQLADTMSKSGGFGLAKTFEHQLSRPPAIGVAPAGASSGTGPRTVGSSPVGDQKRAAAAFTGKPIQPAHGAHDLQPHS